jgi:transcriptional regulator with XRE-family HTH domain
MPDVMIPPETLGERLRRARVHAGISVQTMADDLGVARQTVSSWENNRERPRRTTLLAYAFRCAVPVEWLETGGGATGGYPLRTWSGRVAS